MASSRDDYAYCVEPHSDHADPKPTKYRFSYHYNLLSYYDLVVRLCCSLPKEQCMHRVTSECKNMFTRERRGLRRCERKAAAVAFAQFYDCVINARFTVRRWHERRASVVRASCERPRR